MSFRIPFKKLCVPNKHSWALRIHGSKKAVGAYTEKSLVHITQTVSYFSVTIAKCITIIYPHNIMLKIYVDAIIAKSSAR